MESSQPSTIRVATANGSKGSSYARQLKFVKALRHAPKNTVGGISGLTYDIMRQWPTAFIHDVYAACCEWETKAVPIESTSFLK